MADCIYANNPEVTPQHRSADGTCCPETEKWGLKPARDCCFEATRRALGSGALLVITVEQLLKTLPKNRYGQAKKIGVMNALRHTDSSS